MKKTIFYLVVICLVAGSANAQWSQGNKKVKGNGNMTSSSRTVEDYDQVALTGSMDVELISGTEGNLTIEAEENLIQYITTEVRDGELEISVKKGYNLVPGNDKEIKIIVPFEDLDEVSLTGSGDIYASDEITAENFSTYVTGSGDVRLPLKAKSASASITGSGDIELNGSAEDFTCKVTGSGDISAFDFKCENVNATVTGSGNIQVYATEELRANVPGAGDIEYKGNPKKEDFKTMGVGSVTKQ